MTHNYWKKYNSPNNFWDYMRLIKYYDQSMFPQLKKMIPARAKASVGVLIEPNIFERSKIIKGRKPSIENTSYTSSAVIPGRDNQFAILPEQMKKLSDFRDNYEKMNIDLGLDLQECEIDIFENYRGRWSKDG